MSQKILADEDSLLASLNGDTVDMTAYQSNCFAVEYDWNIQLEMKLSEQKTFNNDY